MMNRIHWISIFVTLALLLGYAGASPATAQEACNSSGAPVVRTDRDDYAPFETVTISGSGFGCGAALSVLVTAPDGSTLSGDGAGTPGPDPVSTDANGEFELSYQLYGTRADGSAYMGQEGQYTIQVLDAAGTVLASAAFSDSLGGLHSCALTDAGGVKCWGWNYDGQLGNGTRINRATPRDVFGLTSGAAHLSGGDWHTCAVTTMGGVKCWGDNAYGQLGDGTLTDRLIPVNVSGLSSGVKQVSASSYHTCALMMNGGVKCWGRNSWGQLGDGSTMDSLIPVDVNGLGNVIQISTGRYHTCALTVSGGAKCWGSNGNGQLGDGTYIDSLAPVGVSGLNSGVFQIDLGMGYSCALISTGGVKCWGHNYFGQLGDGARDTRLIPVDVIGLNGAAREVSLGSTHTCALMVSGGVKYWGQNYYGQLGNGSTATIPPYAILTPQDVLYIDNIAQVRAGSNHNCALSIDGGVKCWGYNVVGQVGDGTPSFSRMTPVDVYGLTSGVAQLPDYYNKQPIANPGGPYLSAVHTLIEFARCMTEG